MKGRSESGKQTHEIATYWIGRNVVIYHCSYFEENRVIINVERLVLSTLLEEFSDRSWTLIALRS